MLPLDAPVMDPLPPDMGMRSPSASLPLDRAFRVRLDAASAGAGEVRLVASPTDPGARLRWEAVGGALEACGSRATFRPDGSGPAVVVVFAEGDGGRLDVARHVV
jgi:hypothetical protein